MQGDRHDKQQNMVERLVVLMLFCIQSGNGVEVGRDEIQHVQKESSGHYT